MKSTLTLEQLMEMEQRQRAHLINSIGGFKSVALIGSIDLQGQTNLAIFSSIVHIGSNPPLLSFIMRPDSVERHTLANILDTGFYTINHINAHIFEQAHQTSARYPKSMSEFDATGLTPQFKNEFVAPFVEESQIQLAMEFKERIDIKAGTITVAGLDSYHTTQPLQRLPYAKP